MDQQTIDYQKLAAAMIGQMGGTTTKAVSSTPNWTYGHGPGGLFSAPGLSQPLFSAMVLPQRGLISRLPAFPTVDVNPLFGIITGVTATSGSNPTGVCDNFPQAGLAKLCTHTFVLGRWGRDSKVIDIDRVGKRTNRGEYADFMLYGNPFQGADGAETAFVPTLPGNGNFAAVGRSELTKSLFELAVAFSRDFAPQIYEGNPANNTSGQGYMEFFGLNSLINTGYRDAITGVACTAADSIVSSFQNQNVAVSGAALVNQVTDMHRRIMNLAARAGLAPLKLAMAMPYELFYEITKIWPCVYQTSGCVLPNGSTQFIDAREQIALRDRMRGNLEQRTGQFLLIDGQEVEVILDDAIDQDGIGSGTMQSQIYFVPLTVLGSRPVTYMEYFDYNAEAAATVNALAPNYYKVTDGGRFMWHYKPPTQFCIQVSVKTEPRLILLTPYLAGRLTNIRYTPLAMTRSPFTESSYHQDGGQTSYSAPSYYSPTA